MYDQPTEIVRPLVTEQYATTVSEVAPGAMARTDTGDIESILLETMMAVAADAERDLKAVLADMQAKVAAKQRLRQLLSQVNQELGKVQGDTGYGALVREAQGVITGHLDAMNGMSEETSLRLREAMDRHAKLMTTLSNVLKKMSDTSSAITGNMK